MSYEYNKRCIYPECGKKRYARGLCATHYDSARKLVKLGKTSWEKLLENGKVELLVGRHKPAAEWFLEERVVVAEGNT